MNHHEIIVKDTPLQAAITGADLFVENARISVTQSGSFAVAISGGSTPRPMHRLLAQEPYCSKIPWSRTELFWVDERCISVEDPASNYGMARTDFLNQVPIPKDQVHPILADLSPEQGAQAYTRRLIDFFHLHRANFPVFDLIYLGIGLDGHTASLFPGQDALDETERLVMSVKGGDPYVSRLTLTFPVINRAKRIVFMVSGRGKADTLRTILECPEAGLPAQRVRPLKGSLTWLLDNESASMLSKESFPRGPRHEKHG